MVVGTRVAVTHDCNLHNKVDNNFQLRYENFIIVLSGLPGGAGSWVLIPIHLP